MEPFARAVCLSHGAGGARQGVMLGPRGGEGRREGRPPSAFACPRARGKAFPLCKPTSTDSFAKKLEVLLCFAMGLAGLHRTGRPPARNWVGWVDVWPPSPSSQEELAGSPPSLILRLTCPFKTQSVWDLGVLGALPISGGSRKGWDARVLLV